MSEARVVFFAQEINAVHPSAYRYASNALAYLMGGGQVIFHDTEDVVAEILTFVL